MTWTLISAAVLLLGLAGAAAFLLGQRGRRGAAALVLALAPVAGVLPYVVHEVKPATPPATTAGNSPPVAAEATATTPVAETAQATQAAGSVAPMSGARPGQGISQERAAAEALRVAGKYVEARDAYRQIATRRPQDADAWADAADCAAAAAGGDLEAGAVDMDRALAAQPAHAKALWLKASLELQRKHYGAAAALWQRLTVVLPPGSEDRRMVEANLEEAKALAGMSGKAGS